ncbi:DUF456 domain-containing protein [Dokdonia donghaensis]|uniref:Membrane protein n=1 Tax=Dokdonia donghaensis DSW-1 TaxID=1300343 RepID=A0A0A2H3B0_9FLAO|nr:DUF456 domain-containing protein [Dokdonia donghaensis]ANH59794.1 hypothetical protein I597_0867 [Dokdonia donghaensis DSW-1]KGO07130.1 membrane protein [Dokdonia donghaensis DSW-1]
MNYVDLFLVFVGLLLVIAGFVGSFLPVIPGPPLSWLGLLTLHLTDAVPQDWTFLGITLAVAVAITILDYIIPAMGTKRYGGSRAGAIGTTIGLIVGLLSPIPLGFLIGAFVGAFIGELTFNNTSTQVALKAALGSFIGFIASTFIKAVVTMVFLVLYVLQVIEHKDVIFSLG